MKRAAIVLLTLVLAGTALADNGGTLGSGSRDDGTTIGSGCCRTEASGIIGSGVGSQGGYYGSGHAKRNASRFERAMRYVLSLLGR